MHGPDYSVVFKAQDGRELHVGRIFYDPTARAGIEGDPWFWSVEFHQRRGRREPHQGICEGETAAKEATGNLKLVQKLLRHEDVATTVKYAHADDEDLRIAMESVEKSRKNPRKTEGAA